MSSNSDQLDGIFLALGDRTRRDLLLRLVQSPHSVSELAQFYEISLPAISKHLRALERAGLIAMETSGRNRIAHIAFETIATAQLWLETLDDAATQWDALEARIDALSETHSPEEPASEDSAPE